MSEKQLWCAVIQQALIDATEPLSINREAVRLDQLRSRDWLTKPNKDFNIVCALAGLEHMRVRTYATKLVADAAQNDQPLGTPTSRRRANRNNRCQPAR
ncbi:hypothetical protein ACVWWG_007206 [Bradyrhizobium sp. LB7.2]